jgi:hypothetical protein
LYLDIISSGHVACASSYAWLSQVREQERILDLRCNEVHDLYALIDEFNIEVGVSMCSFKPTSIEDDPCLAALGSVHFGVQCLACHATST